MERRAGSLGCVFSVQMILLESSPRRKMVKYFAPLTRSGVGMYARPVYS